MNLQALVGTARMLFAGDKRLLEMDESIPTCDNRFGGRDVTETEHGPEGLIQSPHL